jgi:CRP-like cAMP-binding protein
VPIRQFLNGERFDPDTTRIMGVAFEMACVALRLADRGDLAKAVVAEKIIELAKAGERDANTLCERSLNELAPMLDKLENQLLAALEPGDYALLMPHPRAAYFTQGAVLQEQEAPVAHVYFPMNGMVSLVSVMEDGQVVESAVVGREGAVGAFAGLGPWSATRATVQIPATVAVISTSHFQAAVNQSERIRDLILRYKESLLGQVQQTAACNALHPLEARLARWLLQALDRTDERELPLTQDSIAQMLGARRTTVTLIAGKLQEAGLIRYRRGRIIILDKAGLEHLACECYRAIRRRTEGVVPPTQRKVLRSLGAGRITLHGEDRASLAAGTLNIGEQSTMGADHDGVDR